MAGIAALALLGFFPPRVGKFLALLAGGILCISAVWIGAYWQLLPLYAAVLLMLVGMELRPQRSRPASVIATATVFLLLVLTAGLTYVLPMFRLPQPSGPYPVGTRIVSLTDSCRKETHLAGSSAPREFVVQFWYPAAPSGQPVASYRRRSETTQLSRYMDVLWTHSHLNAPLAGGGPYPVLLFNPAWGGQRTQNTYQTEDLASHGFIVASIDHPFNSGPVALGDGRVIPAPVLHDITDFSDTTVEQQLAIGAKEVHIQAADDVFVLNYLAGENRNPHSLWFQRVDTSNAGAFGHSFGGAVSAQACYEDGRIHAALNEDGWMFGDVVVHGLAKPYMVMSDDVPNASSAQLASAGIGSRRAAEMNRRDEDDLKQSLRTFGGYMLRIRGSHHNNFSDRVLYSPVRRLTEAGRISPQRGHAIIEAYTLAFFSQALLHAPAPLLSASRSPYQEVQYENWFAHPAPTH